MAKSNKMQIQSMSLPEKYRPKKLEDFVGQQDAVDHVNGFIKRQTIPKALRIVGKSGCGKTTLARIIALTVNGNETDIIEINVSDKRTIDDIRTLVEKIKFKPQNGYFKFVILDEAHALLAASASALLKVIEEPPAHVVFIMCTDQPEKLISQLRNRCEEISLNPVETSDIYKLLVKVCKSEKIDFKGKDKKVLKYIAESSNNTPRQALQNLNDIYNKFVGSGDIKSVLNTINKSNDEDTNAIKILLGIYKNRQNISVNSALDVENVISVIIKMLDLNHYILCNKSNKKTYVSVQRKLLEKNIDINNIKLNKALFVHSILGKYRMNIDQPGLNSQSMLLSLLGEIFNANIS